MIVPAHAKYQIIQEMTQRNNNMLSVTWLCEVADVSRSGYYHYLATETSDSKGKTGSTGLSSDSRSLSV